jgi:hypothetical protein
MGYKIMATEPTIVSGNVKQLVAKGAPESDIDAYMKSEGYNSPEEFKAANASYGEKVLKDIGQTAQAFVNPIAALKGGYQLGKEVIPNIPSQIKSLFPYKSVATGTASPYVPTGIEQFRNIIPEQYGHPIESLKQGKLASTAIAWALPYQIAKGGIGALRKPGATKINVSAMADVAEGTSPELLNKSITTKTPLLDIADENIYQLAETAKDMNTKARTILRIHSTKTLAKQGAELENTFNNVFGTKSKLKNLEDIETSRTELAKPAYNEAFKAGDLNSKIDPLAPTNPVNELIQDKAVKRFIDEARSPKYDISGELTDLPDSHIKVIDAAKQRIDDSMSTNPLAVNQNRKLMEVKNRILSTVDPLVPEYAKARQIWETGAKLKEAQELGSRLVDTENPESIGTLMEDMKPAEKEALQVGLRDTLMKKLGKGSMSDRANIAEKMFGADSPTNIVRNNLKTVMGIEPYNKLMSNIDPLIKSGRNASRLIGGSKTSEVIGGLEQAHIPRSMKYLLKQMGSKKLQKIGRAKYEPIAKALTDPDYLKQLMTKPTPKSIGMSMIKPFTSKTSIANLINLSRQSKEK